VLLVGHNPGFADLLALLVPQDELEVPKDGKLMPTATLARLAMPDDWSRLGAGNARLLSLTRPRSLPKKFPFPSPFGAEERDRPAYYYTQSSAIPYQVTEDGVRILVISSSKKKHFVMPKGIKEPGLSPQASAAKEALEEAGILGTMGEQPVGSYNYQKWGASVTVDVYPMEVTEIIPEAQWEERHRGREWVAPEEAAARVKQRELAPMILGLAERLRAG
jgi:phosphohistidine phosphatase